MRYGLRDLTAGSGGAGLQVLGATWVDVPSLHAAVDSALIAPFSLLAFAGLQLALPRPRTVLDEVREAGIAGMDEAEAAQMIADARGRVERLDALCAEVGPDIRPMVCEIAEIGRRIVDGFTDDPGDLQRSRTFLRHHLGGAIELIEKYVKLSEKAQFSDSANEVLGKFADGIADMKALFKEQYEKNLSDDVADLDVHLEVYRNLANREGI